MKPFKPMLASPFDEALLKFPVLASPKLDGVRAIVRDGVVLSRALKPIPNKWVQQRFSHLEHFDGELIVGASNHPDVLRTTTSGVIFAPSCFATTWAVSSRTGLTNPIIEACCKMSADLTEGSEWIYRKAKASVKSPSIDVISGAKLFDVGQ